MRAAWYSARSEISERSTGQSTRRSRRLPPQALSAVAVGAIAPLEFNSVCDIIPSRLRSAASLLVLRRPEKASSNLRKNRSLKTLRIPQQAFAADQYRCGQGRVVAVKPWLRLHENERVQRGPVD